MSPFSGKDQRDSERIFLDAPIEFMIDKDVVEASSIDVSQTGISFSTSEPLPVDMRISIDGVKEERRAYLVWIRQDEDGSVRYGLRFSSDDPVSTTDSFI